MVSSCRCKKNKKANKQKKQKKKPQLERIHGMKNSLPNNNNGYLLSTYNVLRSLYVSCHFTITTLCD